MESAVKVVVFTGEDFGYWKNRTRNYLMSKGHAIWEIVQKEYVILESSANATPAELKKDEYNSTALNIITTTLGRKVYERVSHLRTANEVWVKLCNTYEGSSEIKSPRLDTYNRHFQTFSQKSGESIDDCFARFESIVSNLRTCASCL